MPIAMDTANTRNERPFILFLAIFLALVYLPGSRGVTLESRCTRCFSPSYNKVCCYVYDRCCSSKTTEVVYSATEEPLLLSSAQTEESSKQDEFVSTEPTVAEFFENQTLISVENSTDVETSSEILVEATNSTLNEFDLGANETNDGEKQPNTTLDIWTLVPLVNLNSSDEHEMGGNVSSIDEMTTVGSNSLDNETQDNNLNTSSEDSSQHSQDSNDTAFTGDFINSTNTDNPTKTPVEMGDTGNGPITNSTGTESSLFTTTEFQNSDSSHMMNDRPGGVSSSAEEADTEKSSEEDQSETKPQEEEKFPLESSTSISNSIVPQSDTSVTENVQESNPVSSFGLDGMSPDRNSTEENGNSLPNEMTEEVSSEQSEDESSGTSGTEKIETNDQTEVEQVKETTSSDEEVAEEEEQEEERDQTELDEDDSDDEDTE